MLDPRVPYSEIRWLIGRFHVGALDKTIVEDIRDRAAGNDWPADATDKAVDFALNCHHENQRLYAHVNGGMAA